MFHVEHSRLLPPRKCLTPASREAPPGLEGQQARVPEFHVEPVDWMFHVEHSPLGRGRGAIDGLDHTRLRGTYRPGRSGLGVPRGTLALQLRSWAPRWEVPRKGPSPHHVG